MPLPKAIPLAAERPTRSEPISPGPRVTLETRLLASLRTPRGGPLAARRIDLGSLDARRHEERRARLPGRGRLHEVDPYRKRGLRSRKPERVVVVEADPDDHQQIRREADEPGVASIVGGTGLSRCGKADSSGSSLTRGAAIE